MGLPPSLYTETSLSWTSNDFWYRNMPLGFLLVMLSSCALLLGIRQRWPVTHLYLDNWTIAAVCLIVIPAFRELLYTMGKYSLLPQQGVVVMIGYGCCTQGLIFPREQASSTDSIIGEYADHTGLTHLAFAPQKMQHVGLQSSRDNLEINTQSTWVFWFEEPMPRN
jgi:hypothetical protein